MTILVWTDNGVEDATQIDPEQLETLARWLCSEKEAHNDGSWERLSDEGKKRAEDAFDEEQSKWGYCRHCRDFAGHMLTKFNVIEREASHAA